MQYQIRPRAVSRLLLAAASLMALGASAVGIAQSVESAVWKEHKVKVYYYGMTSLYTCDGIEDKVKQILVTFGARKDAAVKATGCEYGAHVPSKTAWVTATFHALAPGTPGDTSAPIKAKWAAVQLAPNRPMFMGAGECEVVDQLRKTITDNFTLRDLEYRTSCMPRQINLADYHVKAQALIAE